MRKLVLGLAPVLLALSAPALAQAPQWRVSEVSGEVRIVDNGRARAATRGMLLSSGSTIATAARSRAVLVRGQEFVVVSPSSQLRVADSQQSRGVIQLISDWGTALFRIDRRSTPHFGVQTPYLAAVVKGTTFTVTVGEGGASVQVTEGAVEVSTVDGGAAELVRPGMIVSVAARELHQLAVQGDGQENRVVRSQGRPAEGAVTVPAGEARVYHGPPGEAIVVEAPVSDPVSVSDGTEGLVHGNNGAADLALAEIRDHSQGNGNGNGNPPTDPGNGNPPTDPGNGNGTPPADPGNGTPPADPGNGNPPADPGNGNPPTDPGAGNPPTDPGNGNPPTDPGNGNPPVGPGPDAGSDAGQGRGGPDEGPDRGGPPEDRGRPPL